MENFSLFRRLAGVILLVLILVSSVILAVPFPSDSPGLVVAVYILEWIYVTISILACLAMVFDSQGLPLNIMAMAIWSIVIMGVIFSLPLQPASSPGQLTLIENAAEVYVFFLLPAAMFLDLIGVQSQKAEVAHRLRLDQLGKTYSLSNEEAKKLDNLIQQSPEDWPSDLTGNTEKVLADYVRKSRNS